jgi:hypothetical protein
MTCFLVSIEWLLNSALSAFTHRTNVIELSTIRSDLLSALAILAVTSGYVTPITSHAQTAPISLTLNPPNKPSMGSLRALPPILE